MFHLHYDVTETLVCNFYKYEIRTVLYFFVLIHNFWSFQYFFFDRRKIENENPLLQTCGMLVSSDFCPALKLAALGNLFLSNVKASRSISSCVLA
jgi:hypothetical protein